eukprot:Pompholyxophrys_punicea_v1_NODE_1072_length_989_cov_3.204497.p1 type:complete len:121 gc:universal NODE_1072_length_989_cov_3.204497:490-128(-)
MSDKKTNNFTFQAESASANQEKQTEIETQIAGLNSTCFSLADLKLNISHHFVMTMVDGKVGGHVTETHSTSCFICHATPSVMNDLKVFNRPIDEEALALGLSTLHLWIRCLEYCWNVAIR